MREISNCFDLKNAENALGWQQLFKFDNEGQQAIDRKC